MARKEVILEKLNELLEKDVTRSKKGRVWELFEKIEEMKKSGVSIANIEAHLNELVFVNGEDDKLKPGSLTSYLYQIRKERNGSGEKVAPARRPQLLKTSPEVKTAPAAPGKMTAILRSEVDLKQFKNK